MKVEIIEASPIEWGLLIDDKPGRTWWKSSFPDGKPTAEHPKIKEAIAAQTEYEQWAKENHETGS